MINYMRFLKLYECFIDCFFFFNSEVVNLVKNILEMEKFLQKVKFDLETAVDSDFKFLEQVKLLIFEL